MNTLDTFTHAYVECALWSSTDNDGTPLDSNYTIEHIAPDTLTQMISDCTAFQDAHANRIAPNLLRAGHDFWLTRNHHGAGFWDGYWTEDDEKVLTDATYAFGEFDLYVGDDGLIYN